MRQEQKPMKQIIFRLLLGDKIALGERENRHCKTKSGTGTNLTFGPDFAAVSLDNMFGDCQTQASTAFVTSTGFIHFVKSLKNASHIIRGDADAGIAYLDQ